VIEKEEKNNKIKQLYNTTQRNVNYQQCNRSKDRKKKTEETTGQ